MTGYKLANRMVSVMTNEQIATMWNEICQNSSMNANNTQVQLSGISIKNWAEIIDIEMRIRDLPNYYQMRYT
jgi:hypothetical protein